MNDKNESENESESDIEILWQYMQCHQPPADADCLLVLGSRDDRVATYAGELAQTHCYSTIVVSGGGGCT